MSYQWQDYNQQYQGWNPQMMMRSDSHTLQQPANKMSHQYLPQQSSFTYMTSAQHATSKPPPPPPPIAAKAYNTSQPHQHYTYGPIRAQTHRQKAAPFIQQTPHTLQTQAATNPAQHTATAKPTHAAPATPQIQPKAQQLTSTPTPTQTTPTHSPTSAHVVPTKLTISDKWTATAECYDSNTNLGGPLYRVIQPTAWSRRRGLHGQDPLSVPFAALARYGAEDHAVRLFSQGKFTGVVATRTVAESVFLSQLVKSLRDHNVDLDMAAEACHKGPIPSKTSDAIRFFQPLLQNITDEIKNKIPIEASLEQIHKLADTEAQLAKAQQKLQQHGKQVTPQRNTPIAPALPTHSSDQGRGSQQAEPQVDMPDEDTQPATKKPRMAEARRGADSQTSKTLQTRWTWQLF